MFFFGLDTAKPIVNFYSETSDVEEHCGTEEVCMQQLVVRANHRVCPESGAERHSQV